MKGSKQMELNRAFDAALAILAKVSRDQLDEPTPCASWDVRALINHFTGTARWAAATVAGEAAVAEVDYAAGDFVAAYEESIQIAVAAFAADGALDRPVRLPFGEFPGAALMTLAATDQFTHAWDLARAIGLPTDLDPGLAEELLGQARLAVTARCGGRTARRGCCSPTPPWKRRRFAPGTAGARPACRSFAGMCSAFLATGGCCPPAPTGSPPRCASPATQRSAPSGLAPRSDLAWRG